MRVSSYIECRAGKARLDIEPIRHIVLGPASKQPIGRSVMPKRGLCIRKRSLGMWIARYHVSSVSVNGFLSRAISNLQDCIRLR